MARANNVSVLDDTTLVERLAEHRTELFNLRFQNATGQLDNYARLRMAKREIARLETERRVREIAAAEAQPTTDRSA